MLVASVRRIGLASRILIRQQSALNGPSSSVSWNSASVRSFSSAVVIAGRRNLLPSSTPPEAQLEMINGVMDETRRCYICMATVVKERQPLPVRNCEEIDGESFRLLLNNINTVIFDADGVLWLGENALPGSAQLLKQLLNMGKQVILLTNNATKSRRTYEQKLAKLGFDRRLTMHNIVNPAAVVADTLHRSKMFRGKMVYLIGSQGIKEELDHCRIEYFGEGPDPVDGSHCGATTTKPSDAYIFDIALKENVGAVIVGYEKYFNYVKLMKAVNYLQDGSCLFIATNEDETCPGPNPNVTIPDAGPLVAAVKVASGREPLVVGKPHRASFDFICERFHIDPLRTLMVGDRTNTDIKFGRDHGLHTMLVLSGCHSTQDIIDHQQNGRDDHVPDFYCASLGALL